ncbi:hypothetical protein V1264_017986 [Littorina saxatilis]|uniref:C2H2-type domain-containing protein n=2 Tax=Littorina saxatilis TaxID=31220 RepID=A0AAN9GGA2_9CAEN
MYYKILLTNFIKCGSDVGKYSCLHCDTTDMSRQKTGDHICINVDGFASCVTESPEGRKLTKQDVSNLFHVNEKCSLCDHCGAQFSEVIGLESHLHNVHSIVTERLEEHKCETCGALFPTRSRLNRHANAKHRDGPDAKTYMCDFCGKAYPSKSTMFRHRQFKHISGERFQCEYCPKKFFKRHLWIIHTKRHLGEAPHQCQVCGKDFSCKYNLKTHERIHSGERPYQCKLCEAAFAQKTSLDVHMKKHQVLT